MDLRETGADLRRIENRPFVPIPGARRPTSGPAEDAEARLAHLVSAGEEFEDRQADLRARVDLALFLDG